MSQQAAKLFYALYHEHGKNTQQDIITTLVPNRTRHSVDGKSNNGGPAQSGSNANNAIIETVTNALDAVIMYYMNSGFFKTVPQSVNEALEKINDTEVVNKSKVFVLTQKKAEKFHTITVVDEGSGIRGDENPHNKNDIHMTSSILAYGHGFKVGRNYQHGTFGQGGSQSIPFATGTLIVSRIPDSDRYSFTYVYLEKFVEEDRRYSSYVYIKDGNHKFYTFTIDELRKFGKVVITKDGFSKENLELDDIILPEHGTVRRMFGMNVNCSPDNSMSLHRAFSDNLFGTNGWVTLMSDNEDVPTLIQTGRRHLLDNCQVGYTLLASESPTLLEVIPEQKMIVPMENGNVEVLIKTWFLDNFRKNNKPYSPARGFFSYNPDHVISTIFVTLNGQTHGKLANRRLLSDAGYSFLHDNIAVEISINDVDPDRMHEFMASTREKLKDDFSSALGSAVVEYFKNHKEFETWNTYFLEKLDSKSDPNHIAAHINRMMNNPIAGLLSANNVGAGVGNNSPKTTSNPVAFMSCDPPTFLGVLPTTILSGGTAWVTINTNAPDYYESSMVITLPSFVTAVNEEPKLKNGRMTFQVIASEVAIGTVAQVTVKLGDLFDIADMTVVAEKKKHRHKGKNPSVPEIKIVDVYGPEDENYDQGFPGCIDKDIDPLSNYNFDEKNKIVTLYMNRKNKEWERIVTNLSAKHSKEAIQRFDRNFILGIATLAMTMVRNESFGNLGATDSLTMSIISDSGRSHLISNAVSLGEEISSI